MFSQTTLHLGELRGRQRIILARIARDAVLNILDQLDALGDGQVEVVRIGCHRKSISLCSTPRRAN